MGGLITIGVALERPNLFDAVVLSAPPTTIPPTISKPLYYGGKLLAKILPNLRPVGLDMSTLTRSPEVRMYTMRLFFIYSLNIPASQGSGGGSFSMEEESNC